MRTIAYKDTLNIKQSWMCCVQSYPILCNPKDSSLPGSSVHRFPRQKYWSGLPFSTSGDLCNAGIKPMSLVSPAVAGRSFTTAPPGMPQAVLYKCALFQNWSSVYLNIYLFSLHNGSDYILFVLKGNGNPLQYSCLKNPMDRRAL